MVQGSSIATVEAALRLAISDLHPGARLPSTRSMVSRYGVSPVTVSRVLAALAADGLVQVRPGSGTFVADRPAAHDAEPADLSWQTVALGDRSVDTSGIAALLEPTPEGALSLASGYPDVSLMPTRALGGALARSARRPDAWERPPLAGVEALRAWFARSVGGSITAADVTVTGGGQAALSAAFRAILPAGGSLLVEAPTYPGALAVARAAGLRPIGVPTDVDGIRPDLLADTFAATGARALYCQPTYANPSGSTLARGRRADVLGVARAAGAFVIEDDYARWLAHERPAPPPLVAADSDGRVVHIASLTKAASPSLRIGALIARGPVAARLRSLRVADDFFIARALQETAVELVSSPAWPRHLSRLSAALVERRDALLRALRRRLPGLDVRPVPAGGMHVWARLPDGTDDVALHDAARRAGVLVVPGRLFFAAEPPAPYLRLSFSGPAHVGDIDDGVRRLARAWEQTGHRREGP